MAIRSINVLGLCAGIGGLERGISIATGGRARTVCYAEGEAYAAACLVARMQDKSLDSAPIFSDVKAFDPVPWRGVVDCVAAGYPCFRGDMLVLSKEGYREISSLRVGDRVLSHTGKWRKITAVMCKQGARLRTIRAQGTTDIVTTDEHPFYTRRVGRCRVKGTKSYKRTWAEPRWVAAGELGLEDYLGQVLPQIVTQEGSLDYWWLVGRYLADGWRMARPGRTRKDGKPMANTGGRVIICCGHHESDELARRIARAGFSACKDTARTGAKFHITNSAFFNFLEPFGKYAYGKTMPGFALALDAERSRALLDGYISGDGWIAPNGDRFITTVSKSLALGACLLAQRAYGIVGSIRSYSRKRICIIEGRTVNERPQHRVHIPNRNRSAFIDGDYGWKRQRKNEESGVGDVYNIAVDKDESYVVNGAIVHNCQPFSSAGRRRGEQDPRHLWPYIAKIIAAIEPQFVFCENVPGHLTLGFEQVCLDLQSMGYAVTAGLFSAAETGAVHLRKRLYFLAHTNRLPPMANAGGSGLIRPSEPRQSQSRHRAPAGDGAAVANAADYIRWQQCAGGKQVGWADDSVHAQGQQGECGPAFGCEEVANADVLRCEQGCAKSAIQQRGQRPDSCGDGGEGADATSPRPQERPSVAIHACSQYAPFVGICGPNDTRETQSRLGELAAGLPDMVDAPANPWGPGWEDGVPRVTTEKEHRIDRLRALGNAVVPQTAALAWRTLMAQAGLD